MDSEQNQQEFLKFQPDFLKSYRIWIKIAWSFSKATGFEAKPTGYLQKLQDLEQNQTDVFIILLDFYKNQQDDHKFHLIILFP